MKVHNIYLLSSHGCLVQDKADLSLTTSAATVAFLNIFQQKSHSSCPPAEMALQYTVDLRFGWILTSTTLDIYFKIEIIRSVFWVMNLNKQPK